MKLSDIKKGYAGLNAGQWVDNLPVQLFDGISLKLRRIGNPDFLTMQAKLNEESSDLSSEANDQRILKECVISTCLLDWKGVDDPFTIDTARELLADPDLGGPFWNLLLLGLNKLTENAKAALEADTKNSPTP